MRYWHICVLNENDPGKRKLDNMGKREKADVITIEKRMDSSANRRISHKKKY